MSYILDALRKLEQHRRPRPVPRLQTVAPASAPRLVPVWLLFATGPPASTPAPAAAAPTEPDIPPAFREALAKLRLEALVYSDDPPDRKVFINGRSYAQGDQLEGGIVVEEILD